MAMGGPKVTIAGDWTGGRAVKQAQSDLSVFEKNVSGFTGNMSKSFLGIGAAIGGAFAVTSIISGFTNFLRDSAQAAMEDEKSLVSLAVAMNNLGLATENAGVEDFVLQLSLATGVADDQLRPAMQRLLTVTGDVAKSQDALRLAMDIAQGTGRDLESVVLALSRGFGGNTTALSRLGAGLDQATLKSKDMDLITGALADKFSGQAAAAADTFQGKMNRLNVAVGEAQETIGYELLIALDDAGTALGGVGGFSDALTNATDKVADIIAGIGVVTTTLSRFRIELVRQGTPADAFLDFLGEAITRLDKIINPFQAVISIFGDLGDESRDARGEVSATTQAAVAAGNAMAGASTDVEDLSGALDGLQTKARSAAAAFDILYGNANRFAGVGVDAGLARADRAEYAAAGLAEDTAKSFDKLDKAARSAASSAKDSAKGFGELRKELLASLEDSPAERYAGIIEQLRANLNTAQQAFTAFKDSVVQSITQAFSFGDAYQAAKESGITFLDALKAQAENAVGFADRIKQLVILGLSPAALQQVLAAGVTAGTGIANQLIEGGATTIEATNRLVETSSAAADEVAQLAASAYFGAGVKSAQDTLDGFAAQLGPGGPSNKALQRIMDGLAASLRRETTITVTTVHRNVYESVGLPGRAMGGPVTADQAYVVGERGPEVFVPDVAGTIVPNHAVMSPARGGIGGGSINLTVNAGMGTDGAEVGRQIVDALRQYQRRNGPVPIAVA